MSEKDGILIRHPNNLVKEVFRVTWFADMLPVED